MTQSTDKSTSSRRNFLAKGSAMAAGVAVMAGSVPAVHAAEDNTIRLSLIGCGSRGAGAVANALNTKDQGPIKLYAMADLDGKRIDVFLKSLRKVYGDQIDVTPERRFIGFDSYKKATDILKPGDVAMCTTRAYIRPIHVEYAVKKGINVFMEKPFAPDPMGLHRMLRAGKEADKKGVKILAGLQCRHSPARAALIEKIKTGAMGEISYIRANRLGGRYCMANQGAKSNNLMDQLKFGRVQLYWVGSGHFVDYLIHQIDECCWLMDSWPVECRGMGGREVGSVDHGQNSDTYSLEFTFANGKKAFCGFRRSLDGLQDFATYVHGTKKAAQFSGNVHKATVHMFKDQHIAKNNIEWTPEKDKKNPWDYEWMHFIESIRKNKPHNECKRAVYSDYATLMGRAAAHSNNVVTWDQIVNSKFQFCDYLDTMNEDSPAPVKADKDGFFPAPVPGVWKEI